MIVMSDTEKTTPKNGTATTAQHEDMIYEIFFLSFLETYLFYH
jgi:hypothetical protein